MIPFNVLKFYMHIHINMHKRIMVLIMNIFRSEPIGDSYQPFSTTLNISYISYNVYFYFYS
jgi:hypothetical protein